MVLNYTSPRADEESVAVSASEQKYMERFKTEVENGMLKIYYDNSTMVWNDNEKRKLRAYVSLKMLENLKASSGADVNAKSVLKLVDNLKMHFSSGAQFNGEVNIKMKYHQNSGSEINITGNAENLKADLSSGAMFKGYDLTVRIIVKPKPAVVQRFALL